MDAAPVSFTTTVLPANDADPERVPASHAHKTPQVAVLLPSPKYVQLMQGQTSRSFTYHLLTDSTYSFLDPYHFDADAFVEAVLAYCNAQPADASVDAVMAFDCFPTLLASACNEALGLSGPSFRSVFLCSNKFYMRQELSPDVVPLTTPPATPSQFPCVLKVP